MVRSLPGPGEPTVTELAERPNPPAKRNPEMVWLDDSHAGSDPDEARSTAIHTTRVMSSESIGGKGLGRMPRLKAQGPSAIVSFGADRPGRFRSRRTAAQLSFDSRCPLVTP